MLELIENEVKIIVKINNKLSIKDVNDIIDIELNHKIFNLNQLIFKFTSTTASDEEDIFHGYFTLSNDIKLSDYNSEKLQRLYLQWEKIQLSRSSVTFKIPMDRYDCNSGVAPFNPYFFAIVNNLARTSHGFDLVGFGKYLSDNELKFVHQYCSFHPSLRDYLCIKKESSVSERIVIPCKVFELIVDSALAHVSGYRDKIRFKSLYHSRNIGIELDLDNEDFSTSKFLIEFDHVLDSPSIYKESFDFNYYESSGGFLDVLNLPFRL